ncbi:MAG TPA: hypothetical protein VN154_04525 [Rhizomicrobium sp.]|nr:hypothetical protein [Rhizomicrobium sp.]
MSEPRKIDRLLALTERLTEALLADIAALERCRPREMRSPSIEVQQMTALYAREAASFAPSVVQVLPKEARDRLTAATAAFREVLARHGQILLRVRNATEGMIRAIAEDVAKRKNAQRPYAPAAPVKANTPGAMIYNKVV